MQCGYLRLGLRGKILLQQGRGDEARAHGVDPNVLGGVFERSRFGKADHCVLRRDVGGRVLYPHASKHGGHVDDGAAPGP